jgi:outer membrane protein, heavy metal efflux system
MVPMKSLVALTIGMFAATLPAVAQLPADSAHGAAAAPAGDTLPLADVVAMARAANPALLAARLGADAAAEAVPQAGALPDPQVQLSLMNRPLDGFGVSQPMTMNTVQLTQVVPWPGKLGFAQDRARRLASASSLDADEAELALVARVKAAYYQAAFMDRALAVMDQTRQLLRGFLQVSSALYAVGTGLQQDVLRAQVAVAQMTDDITAMTEDRVADAARLNALLGRDATAPVGPLQLPEAEDSLPSVDSLMTLAAARRPALAAAHQRELAAAAAYRAARRALYPNLMVGVQYAQRPRFDDMGSLMLGFSLPIWAGSRQLPLRREMQAQVAAAAARSRDLYNETFAGLAEQRAAARRAADLSRLYATAVLPQARASVEAALSAYRVGRVSFLTLVDDQMTVNRYAIERVRLTAAYDAAVAEIEALTAGGMGGGR